MEEISLGAHRKPLQHRSWEKPDESVVDRKLSRNSVDGLESIRRAGHHSRYWRNDVAVQSDVGSRRGLQRRLRKYGVAGRRANLDNWWQSHRAGDGQGQRHVLQY